MHVGTAAAIGPHTLRSSRFGVVTFAMHVSKVRAKVSHHAVAGQPNLMLRRLAFLAGNRHSREF
jgi:hypothetical protein